MCANEFHQSLKRDDKLWGHYTEPTHGDDGRQLAERAVVDWGGGRILEAANCKLCGTTLHRDLTVERLTDAQLEALRLQAGQVVP